MVHNIVSLQFCTKATKSWKRQIRAKMTQTCKKKCQQKETPICSKVPQRIWSVPLWSF